MLASAQNRLSTDVAVALLLAALLTLAWTLQDWNNLSSLRLPDTDDAVRLQQIRDWLSGQAWSDLTQHRLGAGLKMHWSRLPDIVPGAFIAGLSPLMGDHGATLVAVIAWPALLFAVALMLIAVIARALGTSGPLAAIIAALAYPATTLFAPGRIDHHGLQMVLLLVVTRAVIGRGSFRGGAAAGVATAASLTIGVETAPLLAVAGSGIIVRWIVENEPKAQLNGYSFALSSSIAAAALLLRTSGWSFAACDGFTAIFWRAAQVAVLAPLILAGFRVLLNSRIARMAAAFGTAAFALGSAIAISPQCMNPYGQVDPLLARLWLSNVAEAQPLLTAPPAHAFGYVGLMLAGLAAGCWAWRCAGDSRWLALLALQFGAIALAFVQLRGAYAGALLAVPPLAALIAAARSRGIIALMSAWLVSAGMLYPMVGGLLAGSAGPELKSGCLSSSALAVLANMPRGTVMAPIDMGAFLLAASPHSVVAAPYHRNSAGNAAMYRFFLGTPHQAHAVAKRWRVNYVVWCEGGLGMLDVAAEAAPDAVVRRRSNWLALIPTREPEFQLYRVLQ